MEGNIEKIENLLKSLNLKSLKDAHNFCLEKGIDVGKTIKEIQPIAFDNAISFWCVADNLRIGAALNTVRIAEKVIEMGVY